MIANYGYEDASGFYYISIDSNRCALCEEHSCVAACPQAVLAIELDDYDDLVALVTDDTHRRLYELCSPCKASQEIASNAGEIDRTPPCVEACAMNALTHSW